MEEEQVLELLEDAQDAQYDLVSSAAKLADAAYRHPDIDYEPSGWLDTDLNSTAHIGVDNEVKLLTPLVADEWTKARKLAQEAENAYHMYEPDVGTSIDSAKSPVKITRTPGKDMVEYEMLELEELQNEIDTDLSRLSQKMDEGIDLTLMQRHYRIKLNPPRRKGFPIRNAIRSLDG